MFSIFFNVNLHAKKWRAEKWRIFEILSTNEMRHFLAHHCIYDNKSQIPSLSVIN